MYFELLKNFGTRVEKMSGGRLKTEVLPDGAVLLQVVGLAIIMLVPSLATWLPTALFGP